MPVPHGCSCHFGLEPSARELPAADFLQDFQPCHLLSTGMKEPENTLRSNFLPGFSKLRTREERDGHVVCRDTLRV